MAAAGRRSGGHRRRLTMRGGTGDRLAGRAPCQRQQHRSRHGPQDPVDRRPEASFFCVSHQNFTVAPTVEAAAGNIIDAVLVGQPAALGPARQEGAGRIEQIVHPAIEAEFLAARIEIERQEQVVLPHVADVEEDRHLGIRIGFEQR